MTVANDSILVTPGSGATVATHAAGGKEHQAVILTEPSGQLIGGRDLFAINIPSQVHVNSANTVHWDLFNADPALKVRVRSIRQIPDIVTAVTGVVFAWKLSRTTAVGTGGTALTPWPIDTTMAALDADITARSKPTGGATEGTILANYALSGEETNTGSIIVASQGGLELLPPLIRDDGLVLNQNQGLRVTQITSSAAGNTGWWIVFSVE